MAANPIIGPGFLRRSGRLPWGMTMKTLATGLLVLLSALVAESSIAQQGINSPPKTSFYNGNIIILYSTLIR